MLTPLALLLLAAGDGPSISYTAPSDPKTTTLESYEFDKWEPGQTLYVASDEVNLRKTASSTADKVAVLAMGAPVVVREAAGAAVKVNDRVDRWYRVDADGGKTSGYLFGGALTPIRFAGDLDGDGEEEIATVAMTWNFKIRVRVLEPAVKGAGRVAELDLEPSGGAYLSVRGGNARAELVGAAKAGIALVQVDSRPEACTDYTRVHVGYSVPEKRSGTPGKLAPALSLAGMADGGIFSSFEVEFKPKASEVVVIQTQSDGEEDKNGKPITTETREIYRLRGVVFEKK